MGIASINPATGATLKSFDALSETELDRKLQRAADTFRSYRLTSLADRAQRMLRAADILEREKQRLGRLMTLKMEIGRAHV